jgi:hypothetical protein
VNKPKWKKFEELVVAVQRRLSPNALVKHNDRVKGKKSGIPREIDVSIRDTIGEFEILIVIECRDQKAPVGVPDIEQFAAKVQDIGAHKGAFVSASGFASTAPKYAKDVGLNLYRLIDVGEHEWKAFVSIPVLCDFRHIKNYNFKFTTEQSYIQNINKIIKSEKDQRFVILYDKQNKELGRIVDFVNKKLEEAKTLTSQGQHDVVFQNDPIMLKYENSFFEVRIGVKYFVERELYLGFVPLEEFSGFHDIVTEGIVTDGFTTSSLNIQEIRGKWQKIDALDKVAIRPIITITIPGHL